MKVGLFGGSFDPIHNGHMSMIEGALKKVDKVVVIPAVRNSFKRGRILNPAPYRYYMTSDALGIFGEKVVISDIEFFIPGISYTVNTIKKLLEDDNLKKLLRTDEDIELFWICGSDILPTFDKWYDPEGILKLCKLLVAARPGMDKDFEKSVRMIEERFDTHIETFDINGIMISSSEIRVDKCLIEVPNEVRDFVKTNNLYPEPNYLLHCSDEAIEKFYEYCIALYPKLSRYRLIHTINVAIEAVKFAVMYGADPDKTLIAGVLHDCVKEMPDEVQREFALADSGESYDVDKLWHGPGGAYYANKYLGIDDEEILNAIRFHTTGHKDMTILEKVVYLADKIEPARDYDDLTEVRAAASKDLDKGVYLSLKAFVDKSSKKNRKLHKNTLDFANDLGLKV